MKINFILSIFLGGILAFSQVGIGTDSPDPNAILDIVSTDKGLLIPRVDLNDPANAGLNSEGLLVFNTAATVGSFSKGFYYFSDGDWDQIANINDIQSVTVDLTVDANSNHITSDANYFADSSINRNVLIGAGTAGNFGQGGDGANDNVVIGDNASTKNEGSNNTILGAGAASELDSDFDTNYSNNNVIIGAGAEVHVVEGGSTSSRISNNQLSIGNLIYGTALTTDGSVSTGNVGIGNNQPNASALLDLTSTDKGLLIPRLALTSTILPAPLASNEAGMLVYNTATTSTGTNDVSPGFYYNNGTNWIAVANSAIANDIDVRVDSNGNHNSSDTGAALTTGTNNILVGLTAGNAITTGQSNIALGDNAAPVMDTGSGNVVLGRNAAGTALIQNDSNIIIGDGAYNGATADRAIGTSNIVMGTNSGSNRVLGSDNIFLGTDVHSGIGSAPQGSDNIYIGRETGSSGAGISNAIAIGLQARGANNTVAIGHNTNYNDMNLNTANTINLNTATTNINSTTATLIPSGNVGIGSNSAASTLDIKGTNDDGLYVAADGVLIPRVSAIPDEAGADEGELVYVNGDGFYSYIDTTVDNSDPMNPVTIHNWAKLSGGSTDEPWFGADDNTAATTNTEDVYSLGNVGIGTTTPNATLDVQGGVLNLDDGTGDPSTLTSGNTIIHPNAYSAANTEVALTPATSSLGTSNFLLLSEGQEPALTIGNQNLVFGNNRALRLATVGDNNIVMGVNALNASGGGGVRTTTGNDNIFIGTSVQSAASGRNVVGNDNIMLGSGARVAVSNLSGAVAIGPDATVATSNSIEMGGRNGTGASNVTNQFFQINATNTIELGNSNFSNTNTINLNGDEVNVGTLNTTTSGNNTRLINIQTRDEGFAANGGAGRINMLSHTINIGSDNYSDNIDGDGSGNDATDNTKSINLTADNTKINSILNLDDGNGDASTETSGNVVIHPNIYSAPSTEKTFDASTLGTANLISTLERPASAGNNNIIFGYENTAWNSTITDNNIVIGTNALQPNGTGSSTSSIGADNIVMGRGAASRTNGAAAAYENIFIGTNSGSAGALGFRNIFIGSNAANSTNGISEAVAIGASSVVSRDREVVIGGPAGNGASGTTNEYFTVNAINDIVLGNDLSRNNITDNINLNSAVVNNGVIGDSNPGLNTHTINIQTIDEVNSGTAGNINLLSHTINIGSDNYVDGIDGSGANDAIDETDNINLTAVTNIHFETPSVTATMGTVFPDYVFQNHYGTTESLKPEYELMSLKEVEDFTKKNYHLPGIDSAKEVSENGLDFLKIIPGQMEKIEELFLHTIAQEKKLEAQEEKINTQQKEIDELKALVKQLLEKN